MDNGGCFNIIQQKSMRFKCVALLSSIPDFAPFVSAQSC
jgi:hypothetical protein